MPDILPDSRQRPGGHAGINRGHAGTFVPVFCANCGAPGGSVPEENMTFIFYLCNGCAEAYGPIANTMLMPDEVFFARLAEAQLEEAGHYLSPVEWLEVEESSAHPLHRLIRERA